MSFVSYLTGRVNFGLIIAEGDQRRHLPRGRRHGGNGQHRHGRSRHRDGLRAQHRRGPPLTDGEEYTFEFAMVDAEGQPVTVTVFSSMSELSKQM